MGAILDIFSKSSQCVTELGVGGCPATLQIDCHLINFVYKHFRTSCARNNGRGVLYHFVDTEKHFLYHCRSNTLDFSESQ